MWIYLIQYLKCIIIKGNKSDAAITIVIIITVVTITAPQIIDHLGFYQMLSLLYYEWIPCNLMIINEFLHYYCCNDEREFQLIINQCMNNMIN